MLLYQDDKPHTEAKPKMIVETPLVFPGLAASPRRYVIDADAKRLVRREDGPSGETSSALSPLNAYSQQPFDDALPGAASVSSIKLQIGSKHDCLVTTSGLVECPSIISVALSWKLNAFDSPSMIELDTQDLHVVAVRAFELDTHKEMDVDGAIGKFKLVLVGSKGSIVSLILDENLVPDRDYPLKVLFSKEYVQPALLEQIGTSELQTNMVSFLSSNHIIMALAPLLLTIDVRDGKAEFWSETQCLEDMKARSSFLSGFLGSFLGRVEGAVVDMPPVAALCISTNTVEPTHWQDEDATVSLVFTLHSDASIRKWRIDPEASLLPLEVTTLTDDKVHNILARPSTWSDVNKSVALCARLYDGIFALAAHIRTDTLSSYDQGVSDCNIWVFHGHEREQPIVSNQVLNVPHNALSMVGMCFVPNQRRCTLSVTFEVARHADGNGGSRDSTSVLLVKYTPSFMTIVALEPKIIEIVSLDQIATKERDRIQSLSFGSSVLMEATLAHDGGEGNTSNSAVSEALHKLDSLYMKILFRPLFPRGVGTVLAPSDACIRRALSKLVHASTKEYGMSVELETIKTLYEWRSRDKRKSTATSLSPTKQSMQRRKMANNASSTMPPTDGGGLQNLSVYDSFVGPDDELEGMHMDSIDGIDEAEQFEEELAAEIEAHENRWRRLLYQIWEEEQVLRVPLFVSSLASHPVQLLIRGGVTTVLSEQIRQEASDQQPWANELNKAASHLLGLIESNQKKSNALYAIEEQVTMLVARAQLAISPKVSIAEDLTSLGRWARLQDDDSDDGKLKKLVNKIPVADLVAWVEAKPADMESHVEGTSRDFGGSKRVANCQLRHAACSSAIRAIDSVRRSRLGKCLLLLELAAGSHATTASFRNYLEIIAVLWTSAQRIKMPSTTFRNAVERKIQFDDSPPADSPSTKRSICGDHSSTILGATSSSSMTTVLDVVIIEISQRMEESLDSPSSPCTFVFNMVDSFVDRLFLPKLGTPRSLMPELCVLPHLQDSPQSTDYPALALRLLAPFVAFPIPEDSAESMVARKETLSSCLLHASHSSKSLPAAEKSRMRQIACDLLVPKYPDHDNSVDKEMIRFGLDALDSIRDRFPPRPVEDMKKLMQRILPNATSTEIGRLCDILSARTMFMNLAGVSSSEFDEPTHAAIKVLATVMLEMSRVQNRLAILEGYVRRTDDGKSGENYNSQSLLAILADAISEMENTFPAGMLRNMPEYTSLWSKKFHHAVLAGHWREAYDACLWNPLMAHRETNIKQLIHAMVDGGALSDLLVMCTELGMRSSMNDGLESAFVDLYEISAEVLLSYAKARDIYDLRAATSGKSGLPEYQGALYALHASQEQWRRAAQSLDLRYLNAEKALHRTVNIASAVNIQSAELRDFLIVEDLVLASCGSAIAIELVEKPAHRFLVSGENSPYSVIPTGEMSSSDSLSSLKRGRFQSSNSSSPDMSVGNKDRLSRFMTQVELDGRAIRSVALRALFFDRSSVYSVAKSAFLREFDTSSQDISELFKTGYFQHGLLLARSWSKVFETTTGSTKPGGRDLYGSCVSQMGFNLVTLLSIKGGNSSRPTLQQLHIAIDTVGSTSEKASYVVSDKCFNLSSLQKACFDAATLVLVRKLTLSYSNVEVPLALDIANFFLDETETEQLPMWLERLLLGGDSQPSPNGLFAPRRTSGSNVYMGDPAALLSMYIDRGMLFEACGVVISVLNGFGVKDTRAAKAPNRLPEKGDVDFVPYQSIDLLWNVIEIAISKGFYNRIEETEILKSRGRMEEALEKHFELMKISEMGMRSARLLEA